MNGVSVLSKYGELLVCGTARGRNNFLENTHSSCLISILLNPWDLLKIVLSYVYVGKYMCDHCTLEETVGSLRARVTGSCELFDVDAGNRT